MAEKKTEILNNLHQKSVEDIWTALKTAIQNDISEFVPIKKIGLPWLTQEIKRLIRKRDSLYQKQKRGRSRDRHHFKQVKHLVQAKIQMAYNNYLQNILDLSEGGDDTAEKNAGFTSKKLFSLIKNARQDTQGVSPLKDPSTNANFSQNKEKANILLKQTIPVCLLQIVTTQTWPDLY